MRRRNQLTLRDIDARVLAEIQRLSRAEGLSMNRAAAKILKRGAGIADAAEPRCIGANVDRYVGDLSSAEAHQLSDALRVPEHVDEELWK